MSQVMYDFYHIKALDLIIGFQKIRTEPFHQFTTIRFLINEVRFVSDI